MQRECAAQQTALRQQLAEAQAKECPPGQAVTEVTQVTQVVSPELTDELRALIQQLVEEAVAGLTFGPELFESAEWNEAIATAHARDIASFAGTDSQAYADAFPEVPSLAQALVLTKEALDGVAADVAPVAERVAEIEGDLPLFQELKDGADQALARIEEEIAQLPALAPVEQAIANAQQALDEATGQIDPAVAAVEAAEARLASAQQTLEGTTQSVQGRLGALEAQVALLSTDQSNLFYLTEYGALPHGLATETRELARIDPRLAPNMAWAGRLHRLADASYHADLELARASPDQLRLFFLERGLPRALSESMKDDPAFLEVYYEFCQLHTFPISTNLRDFRALWASLRFPSRMRNMYDEARTVRMQIDYESDAGRVFGALEQEVLAGDLAQMVEVSAVVPKRSDDPLARTDYHIRLIGTYEDEDFVQISSAVQFRRAALRALAACSQVAPGMFPDAERTRQPEIVETGLNQFDVYAPVYLAQVSPADYKPTSTLGQRFSRDQGILLLNGVQLPAPIGMPAGGFYDTDALGPMNRGTIAFMFLAPDNNFVEFPFFPDPDHPFLDFPVRVRHSSSGAWQDYAYQVTEEGVTKTYRLISRVRPWHEMEGHSPERLWEMIRRMEAQRILGARPNLLLEGREIDAVERVNAPGSPLSDADADAVWAALLALLQDRLLEQSAPTFGDAAAALEAAQDEGALEAGEYEAPPTAQAALFLARVLQAIAVRYGAEDPFDAAALDEAVKALWRAAYEAGALEREQIEQSDATQALFAQIT